jgi:hypothetical protein
MKKKTAKTKATSKVKRAKVTGWTWHYGVGNVPATPANLRKAQEWINRIPFWKMAETGKRDDDTARHIADFLRAVHKSDPLKKRKFPEDRFLPPYEDDLSLYVSEIVSDFMLAVIKGDYVALRRIADAVERVHARATGEGETFAIAPADLARSRVLAHVEQHGPPQSLTQTRALMLAAGFHDANLDPKTVQRWHKDLGGASGKPGRPGKKSGQTPAKRRPN